MFRASSRHSQQVAAALAKDGTKWQFNTPSAPHFGGLWEAGVKSVKHHLRRVIGEHTLTYEELSTFLVQVEACLNSRPLHPLTDDPEDTTALTPGHFLIGDALNTIPSPTLLDVPMNRLSRWQLLRQLSEHFWKRWTQECLRELQVRPKWQTPRSPIRIGDLAIVKHERLPPTKWALARVTALHPGPDHQVRVVTIRAQGSTLKRPVHKLCILPRAEDETTIPPTT